MLAKMLLKYTYIKKINFIKQIIILMILKWEVMQNDE